ncbi:MAG: hydrolase [Frankiales bacterium]|nr:hydrolase [Frankiales bacterium]
MPTLRARWERLVVTVYTRTPAAPRRAVLRALTPSYRVGVLVVLRRPDGRILLVDQPYEQGWSLPGGDLKRREQPGEGAARELREELGLVLPVPDPVLAALRTHDRWVTFVLLIEVDQETADRAAAVSPELTAVQWCDPAALPELHPDIVRPLALVGIAR